MKKYSLVRAEVQDIFELSELERVSYAEDEAASYDTMLMRQRVAPEYFHVYKDLDNKIVGFVNGTCTSSKQIEHSCMFSHQDRGESLVIHSVVVHPIYRRQGVGQKLLKDYIEAIKDITHLQRILLMSKGHLLAFYAKCGFNILGISSVVHGKVIYVNLLLLININQLSVRNRGLIWS